MILDHELLLFITAPSNFSEKPHLRSYCSCREETYNLDSQFLHIQARKGDISDSHVCSIHISNIRLFLEDIRNFNKKFSADLAKDEYSFKPEGTNYLNHVEVITSCLICGENARSEDALMSFPEYSSVVFNIPDDISPESEKQRLCDTGIKCIHKGCLDILVNRVESVLDKSNYFEKSI